jgi:hypothetical protein
MDRVIVAAPRAIDTWSPRVGEALVFYTEDSPDASVETNSPTLFSFSLLGRSCLELVHVLFSGHGRHDGSENRSRVK